MDQDKWRNVYFQRAIARTSGLEIAEEEPEDGNPAEKQQRRRRRPSASKEYVLASKKKTKNAPLSSSSNPGEVEQAQEEEQGRHHWLEIGPGAMGTLSRMVLGAHPDNKLVAIEAVASSAAQVAACMRRLFGEGVSPSKQQPQQRKQLAATGAGELSSSSSSSSPSSSQPEQEQQRFNVIHGLAGFVSLPQVPINALVAEILGHFGSSEGYVSILQQCGRAYPHLAQAIKEAIPLVFGTKMVPVDLSSPGLTFPLRIGAIEKHLVMFVRFPFAATGLSASHGVMEQYNALEELGGGGGGGGGGESRRSRRSSSSPPSYLGRGRRTTAKPQGAGGGGGQGGSSRTFTSVWTIEATPGGQPRPFHGLAFYLFFGQGGETEWQTSNADTPHPCTNWNNVFVPLGRGQWVVEVGDVIRCVSLCHVGEVAPWYELTVTVVSGGKEKYREAVRVDYHDLVCRVDSVRGWRKYFADKEEEQAAAGKRV